ncbi:hypothetical protein [Sulfurovum sp.]|uniref:Hpt domain-containing protein n=1 Tax=Sulfurovum sp. TaxID=1969726 RepID=UPI0028683087|nr:hypothetical protein [Sulfurovum sp.]
MLVVTILSIFVFIVILFIFLEYRNEKKYQEERHKNRQQPIYNKRTTPSQTPKEMTPKPEVKLEVKLEVKPEVKLETRKLPEGKYPNFTHIRLVEMGLSDEEAKEFVAELIPQIETQFPLIEKAILELDFHQMERLTHGIKGSATNLGTGGVSDLLVEYNTYLKTGTDIDIAKAYLNHLVHYHNELKAQYT